MKLPRLSEPEKYIDLFVVDFGGGQVGVGYTADEVAQFVEQKAYRSIKIYRIHDASPDGKVELVGMSAERFSLEAGMFFGQEHLSSARGDFDELASLFRSDPPPCRVRLVLGEVRDWHAPYQAGLIYPAESDPAVARYLLAHQFRGGQNVYGGVGAVTEFNNTARVLDSTGFAPADRLAARDWPTLKKAVGVLLQR